MQSAQSGLFEVMVQKKRKEICSLRLIE